MLELNWMMKIRGREISTVQLIFVLHCGNSDWLLELTFVDRIPAVWEISFFYGFCRPALENTCNSRQCFLVVAVKLCTQSHILDSIIINGFVPLLHFHTLTVFTENVSFIPRYWMRSIESENPKFPWEIEGGCLCRGVGNRCDMCWRDDDF